MNKERAVKVLIAQLRDRDVTYEEFIQYGDLEPIAAVIVCQGESSTEAVLDAVHKITDAWPANSASK